MKATFTILLILITAFTAHTQCWKQAEANQSQSFAIKSDGTLWAWGHPLLGDSTLAFGMTPKQIAVGTTWKSVKVGVRWTIAIRSDGTLWSWGSNAYGQLGHGNTNTMIVPTQVGTDTNWAMISAGQYHALAIKSNGTLWAWGTNGRGEVGDSTNTNRTAPVQVGSANNWVYIDAGYFNSFGIRSNGTLWAWGENLQYKLGIGVTTPAKQPTQVGTATNWKQVSAGYYHTYGLQANGTLWGWGAPFYGELGNGNPNAPLFTTPAQIGTANDWAYVEAGLYHSLAIKNNGTMWGCGAGGSIGDGTYIQRDTLFQVGPDSNWTRVSSYSIHALATRADSSLWAWGDNSDYELGNGGTTSMLYPIKVSCSTTPTSVATPASASRFVVYPNPASDRLTVGAVTGRKIDKIELLDLSGKLLISTIPDAKGIDLKNLAPGMYQAAIYSEGDRTILSFVKQ